MPALFSSESVPKGRETTMDAVSCLKDVIRKALANKEVVDAIFFDVEKAYDMP